ncbi:MaoC family dehydratase [Myxococcus sp. CA051A]|uniref:Acyl dehydratase n=1 Tax=Myxococcus llanfairpwllgwyngyllgogerychwyrndrobwllllantysiliogogogochensis TaxID=2590453 RepID=A0A540X1K9_9BACT|nr:MULTISPECIES: MaoC family dehydratase [Myxococcus]NTX01566.1 MaoC family dehydratase [Myxococcus sp. CA040A]NTX16206.1 MaoC family dehydratase [Myxococcus sp. CA056]NTX40121.1 MaoC family dehydratase [Myxococcus sp. CA033]NTX57029.1 MaoC family dehydratase [Myxococcus sp. CA039A]NTX63043.1 MaoC family dehydratase [Myxococcus sp. CA051A]
MPARKLYFESIRVGDELPALAKAPVDRVQLSRYAGASGDYNPVHVDELYAKSVGMPSVYAPGMLVMGMLGQLISDWARGGQMRRYNVRFIKMVWPGDTVVCKGRVSNRHGTAGRYFVDIDLWAENQRGELVMKGGAQIQLFYSLEDENRQRSGQSPIVIEVPRESLAATPTTSTGGGSSEASAVDEEADESDERRTGASSKKTVPREKPAAKTATLPSPKKAKK